jgi:GT2 family glycosyltransferase
MFNKKKYLRSLRKDSFIYSKCFEGQEIQNISGGISEIPHWFLNKDKVDVSIIVPLYKSSNQIKEQILNWHFDEKYTCEIIYVNDYCPQNSFKNVLNSWALNQKTNIGNIILNKKNQGYGSSCNIGSKFANGEYLIFLNADCIVFENWIFPIIDLLKDKTNGIIGNLQLKNDNKTIDSAGSEWCVENKRFKHIGRSIYKGKILKKPFTLDNVPKEILKTQEREMVTGCCFGIRKDLFQQLNGFDENYKIGYWEDADLCLRTRALGYKIIFEPQSKIIHQGGHTGSINHVYMQDNTNLFYEKWVDGNKIKNFKKQKLPRVIDQKEEILKKDIKHEKIKVKKQKIIGCIIACNEEEFLEAAVDSISPIVDKWIIVIGGNEYAFRSGMCDKKGYPNDSTLEISKNLVKKYGGIVIEPPGRLWKDKVEMRNQYAMKLKENEWMFMLDGDEVYKPDQLNRIQELMDLNYECFILSFWTFWNNVNTIGTGVWDNYPQERIVKWKKGYHYYERNHLHVSNSKNQLVKNTVKTFNNKKERLFYHYSWVRPLNKIKQKRDYYKYQAGRSGDDYLEKIFLEWRKNPNNVEGNTHPFGGGGTKLFEGEHPIQVQNLIKQNKLNF